MIQVLKKSEAKLIMPQGKCSFVQLKSSKDLSTVLCSVPCSPKAFLMANFSTSSFNTHRELHLKYLLVDFFWEFMLRLLDSNDHTHILTHRQMGKYILHKSPTGHCYSRGSGSSCSLWERRGIHEYN